MLSLKKNKNNSGFPTFKLPFMTDPLNIIFDHFGIRLLS